MENVMDFMIGIAAAALGLSLAAILGLFIWFRVIRDKAPTAGPLALAFAIAALGSLACLEMGLLKVLRDGTMPARDAAIQPVSAFLVPILSFLAGAFWADYTLKKRRSAATARPPTDAPQPSRRGRTKGASA
jgi:hypothetical protein